MGSTLDIAKNMSVTHNVSINVYDEITGRLIKHHEGHNAATNSILVGIGHYLIGDGVLNQGADFLEHWIPKYISLGTMGLYSQDIELDRGSDNYLLPTGIGYSPNASEEDNFTYYMNHTPGFGADGYDKFANPDGAHGYVRKYMGLGPVFADRHMTRTKVIQTSGNKKTYFVDTDAVGIAYVSVNGVDKTSTTGYNESNHTITLKDAPATGVEIKIEYISKTLKGQTIDCELITSDFPRSAISYRQIIPEENAENPKTIDLIFSAMISTGALKQFREEGKDYVLITEAGLWSKKTWPTYSDGKIDYNSGDNGLLAGYRIFPPDDSQQDMSIPENRRILKEQILRVGYNQVVQVVWKIQLGSVSELFTTHPEKESIKWEGFT